MVSKTKETSEHRDRKEPVEYRDSLQQSTNVSKANPQQSIDNRTTGEIQISHTKCPRLVIILSGKRKSGKDYISTHITDYVAKHHSKLNMVAILRIAGPIKREFAKMNNGIEFNRLLDSSSYKENYRSAMVDWSENYRAIKGWNCFLEQAIDEQEGHNKPVWILNDARRTCDVEYFENKKLFSETKIIKLRIDASEDSRIARGWIFTEGIDDKATECGLDSYSKWTMRVQNDGHDRKLEESLRPVLSEIDKALEMM